MNYLAHALPVLDDPYLVAGVGVPDMLAVVDRRVRTRSKEAEPLTQDEDRRVAEVAKGIVQHHRDDRWFHGTEAFNELSLRFAVQLRERLPGDTGFRPSFLGHILVELLLDDTLAREHPGSLERYYAALAEADPHLVQNVVNRIARRETQHLAALIPRFLQERFLFDYRDDARLLFRLNQVMRRVKLPPLPDSLLQWFPDAREVVAERRDDLFPHPIQ